MTRGSEKLQVCGTTKEEVQLSCIEPTFHVAANINQRAHETNATVIVSQMFRSGSNVQKMDFDCGVSLCDDNDVLIVTMKRKL